MQNADLLHQLDKYEDWVARILVYSEKYGKHQESRGEDEHCGRMSALDDDEEQNESRKALQSSKCFRKIQMIRGRGHSRCSESSSEHPCVARW